MFASGSLKFQIKEKRQFQNIPGTRHSASKASLLLSSGIVSFDYILGGGIPVGSVLLIEEDDNGVFSRLVVKYFLAEGIACEHGLYVASLDCDANQLVSELPTPVDSDPEHNPNYGQSSGQDLKIAWRYKDIPAVQSSPTLSGTSFGRNFDLTVTVPKDVLLNREIACWPHDRESNEDPYHSVLQQLQYWIIQHGHSTEGQARKTVLRVAIHSLGSPLWPDADSKLPRFFYCLKAIMRSAYAACVVTIPSRLLQKSTVDHCEHLSDNAVLLESLANNPNPLFSEYSGLLKLCKLSAINTLATHVPETRDWAFKLRKRRFIIEVSSHFQIILNFTFLQS
uniref:Elongator complex protein 4 n=1 Tax=Clastoptera arizonana TaxID=38151 RepID=A0A1B6EFV3_9HEMI